MSVQISGSGLRPLMRLGGVAAIAGGIGYVVAGAIHQDLPSGAEHAVAHVADRPEWYAIHLLVIVSVAMWPVAFAAIAGSLAGRWSRLLGRTGVGAMTVGLTLYIVEMALDGYVLKRLADRHAAAAAGAEREHVFQSAETAYVLLQGVFTVSILWVLGIPFVLLGLAIAAGRPYPTWLGWVAVVLGAVVTVYAGSRYLALDLVPELAGFVIPGFLLALWLVVLGVLVLRRAGGAPA